MELQLFNLLEDLKEVLEENIGLLTIQNVMIADDSSRLHTELRFGQDKESLTIFLVISERRPKFEGLLHKAYLELIIDDFLGDTSLE